MRKKFPLFYKIYFSAIAAFIIILAVSVGILRSYLADYESTLPQYEAEKIFNEYFESRNFSSMLSVCTYRLSEYETYQNLLQYLNDVTANGDLTFSRVSSNNENAYKYAVKSGDNRFCTFSLKVSDEKSKKGFNLYSLDELEILNTGDKKSIAISVPEDAVLYINGTPVKDECITESNIPTDSCNHMPEGVRGIYYKTYTIEGLLKEPEMLVYGSDGLKYNPVYDQSKSLWTVEIPNDESLVDEFGDYVTEAAQKYAVYSQGDCGFSKISKYFDPSSELYTNIRTLENMFVLDHSGWSFEDVKLSEFYRYDENTFSCRISFVHLLHKPKAEDYRDYIDMTLYLKNVNGSYLIYDRYNNN